jgi:hypothetical protein
MDSDKIRICNIVNKIDIQGQLLKNSIGLQIYYSERVGTFRECYRSLYIRLTNILTDVFDVYCIGTSKLQYI